MNSREFKKSENAQGMAEFALILPLLLVIVFGLMEAGRMLFIYSATASSSREAARYGAAVGDSNAGVPRYKDCAGIRDAARQLGNLVGITDSNITISYDDGNPADNLGNCPISGYTGPKSPPLGTRVHVTVKATYSPIIPIPLLKSFQINSVSARTIMKDVVIGTAPAVPPSTAPPPIGVYFSVASQEVHEGDGTATITILADPASSEPVTVYLSWGGSATLGDDYTGQVSSVTIPAGASSVNVTLNIIDDNLVEPDETVLVHITGANHAIVGYPDTHVLTILDNDLPQVFFASSSQSVFEHVGTVSIEVKLSDPAVKTITVPFSVAGGDAINGTDYIISDTADLSFLPGETSKIISVQIVDDSLYENPETFVLKLGTPVNAILGSPDTHTVEIVDNDAQPTVFFSTESQSGTESIGSMTVDVQLNTVSGVDVFVEFSASGTATLGSDYTLSPMPPTQIVIPAGTLKATITIGVIQDSDNTEGDETVILTLGNVMNANKGSPSVHTATITNRTVKFTSSGQTVTEGAVNVTVQAVLSSDFDQTVSVPFTLSGSATSGADYNLLSPTSQVLVFDPHQLTKTITLQILPDSLYEGVETIVITMGDPTNAAKVTPYIHTITINDDDPAPVVKFTSASQSGNEGTKMSVVAQLSVPSGLDVTVPYVLSGTAKQGLDYTITPNPLVIPAGSTSATIDIQTLTDGMDEENETVVITMGAPVNAIKGTPDVHTATIIDIDAEPQIYFSKSQTIVREGTGMAITVQVQLSHVSGKIVSVPIAISGTATQGSDYTIDITGTVTLMPGTGSVLITINPIDDNYYEYEESVILTMGNPTNAILGIPSVFNGYIDDNDTLVCDQVYSLNSVYADYNLGEVSAVLVNGSQVTVNIIGFSLDWGKSQSYLSTITFNTSIIWNTALTDVTPPAFINSTSNAYWTPGGNRSLGPMNNGDLVFQFGNKNAGQGFDQLNNLMVILDNGCTASYR
jgi:hypothetical protein